MRPSVLDFARDELRERPITRRDALTFLLGFALVVTLVVLWLATGQPPAVHA